MTAPSFDTARSLVLPWRTGRHNHRIVYAQAGPEPSDADVMVAVFFEPELAAETVRDHNSTVAPADVPWRDVP